MRYAYFFFKKKANNERSFHCDYSVLLLDYTQVVKADLTALTHWF